MQRFQAAMLLASFALASAPGTIASAQETSGWLELDGSGSEAGISGTPGSRSAACDVAVDGNGHPAVAWLEAPGEGAPYVYLRKWSGSAWVELGGSASGSGVHGPIYGVGRAPQVEFDLANNPIVSWVEMAFLSGEVMAKKFVGGAWVPLAGSIEEGGISQSGDLVKEHAMTVDAAGHPVIAWVTTAGKVHLRRWNGTAWIELGGSGTTGFTSPSSPSSPSVAVDSLNRPWISWVGMVFIMGDVYMIRWDPATSAWVGEAGSETGLGISGTSRALYASMMIDGGDRPAVAWFDFLAPGLKIYAKSLVAGAWTELGGSATGEGLGLAVGMPSMARGPDGNPVVAFPYRDETGLSDTHLKTWTGTAWVGISGSDAGGGISDTPEPSGACSLAIGATGQLAVAWEEGPSESLDIRLKTHGHPALSSLGQYRGNGSTTIALGETVEGPDIVFKGRLKSLQAGVQVRLEVEVQPVGVAFTNAPSAASGLVASNATASVTISGLGLGSYRWQARVKDAEDETTAWTAYGGNDPSAADWIFGAPAPETPAGGGGGSSGGCGGTAAGGLALGALLALAASLRDPARR